MDKTKTAEEGVRARAINLPQKQIELNEKLAAEIMKNPDKMPKAVYFIVPNEFAERFCYYGIFPLLNRYFRDYHGLGKTVAMQLKHGLTALAYFTPLFGKLFD